MLAQRAERGGDPPPQAAQRAAPHPSKRRRNNADEQEEQSIRASGPSPQGFETCCRARGTQRDSSGIPESGFMAGRDNILY